MVGVKIIFPNFSINVDFVFASLSQTRKVIEKKNNAT